MDNSKRKIRVSNSSLLLLTLAILALVGISVHQAYEAGYLPLKQAPGVANRAIQNITQRVINEENAIIDVVEQSSLSVVAIGATQRVFNPFDPFSSPRSQDSTIGTGFVVSDQGVVVTNKHVVSGSNTSYSVVTRDGNKLGIKKIYRDPTLDLALLKVEGEGVPPALDLGDSTQLKVGQTVIAIGNALGRFTNTVTTGIVSGLGREVVAGDPFSGEAESLEDLIQTDAAINPGNSGGPLLNSAGQVIGVNVATTEGAQNIGFAIPINSVKQIADEFAKNGSISRPYLGVRYRYITRDMAIMYEIPPGAYILEIVPGSGADQAGIKRGDIITRIEGQSVDSEDKITEAIKSKKVGDSVSLDIWRDGEDLQVNAKLQELVD